MLLMELLVVVEQMMEGVALVFVEELFLKAVVAPASMLLVMEEPHQKGIYIPRYEVFVDCACKAHTH